MHRIFFLFAFGILLLASCQNTPKTAADTPPAAETPAPVQETGPINQEIIEQTIITLNKGREKALALRNQLDQLPAGVKAKNRETIDAFYNDLEGIMLKEGMMIGDLRKGGNEGEKSGQASEDLQGGTVNPNMVKDYSESVERYNQMVQEMEKKLEAFKGGQ